MKTEIRIEGLNNADVEPSVIQYVDDFADNFISSYREVTNESVPRGRLYRTGIITARRTKALQALGLKDRLKTRTVTGTRIHRASAADQPAARMSGKLINRIRKVKRGKFARGVVFDAPYSGYVFDLRPVGFDMAIDRAIERTAFGE